MMLLDSPIKTFHDDFVQIGAFWWMIWNGGLAAIPAVLAMIFFRREDQPRQGLRTVTFYFEIGLVLLFLPNAPYIATDLIHFLETVRITDGSLWHLLGTEFPRYAAFVIFGLLCYSFTVDRLLYAIGRRSGWAGRLVAMVCIPLLCAVGVYLGRVARFNSWDILTEPSAVLHSSTTVIDSVRLVKVIGCMWGLLLCVHQAYKVFHDGLRVQIERYPMRRRRSARPPEMVSPQQSGTAPLP